jgi:hypothetical protein
MKRHPLLRLLLSLGFLSIGLVALAEPAWAEPALAEPACAEPPLQAGNARSLRLRLAEEARSYLGTPYRSGGTSAAGFDCSGLVYRVYAEVLHAQIPRTVRALYLFSEQIPRSELEEGDLVFFNTTGDLSHIGIYVGDARVVHAASEGPATGVIISSLDEPYYRSRYAGCGRLIPSAEWLGLLVRLAAAPMLGGTPLAVSGDSYLRGGALAGQLWYNLFGVYVGGEIHLEYDAATHLASLPLLLNLSFNRQFWLIAGVTLAAGSGLYAGGGTQKEYRPDLGVGINTWGAGLELGSLRLFGVDTGLFTELTYTHQRLPEGSSAYYPVDVLIGLKAYVGAEVRLRY